MTGTLVNIYVGSRPNLDLVFAAPKGLLSHFSPVLHQQLLMEQAKVIVMERSDKRSVSWVFRWMLAGGTDKTGVPPEAVQDNEATMELLLHRLQLVDELRIPRLCGEIAGNLKKQFSKVCIKIEQIQWAYSHPLDFTPNGLRSSLVQGVLDSALDYELIYPLEMITKEPKFYHDLVMKVDSLETVKRVGAMQRHRPLSVEQIRFLYASCVVHGHLRKTITHGLLKLIDDGKVRDPTIYHNFARENDEFEEDMTAALKTKQRALEHAEYLERKARREARVAAANRTAQGPYAKVAASPNQRAQVTEKGDATAVAWGTKGIKASGPSKIEATTSKQVQKFLSDAILRTEAAGAVTRER